MVVVLNATSLRCAIHPDVMQVSRTLKVVEALVRRQNSFDGRQEQDQLLEDGPGDVEAVICPLITEEANKKIPL